MAKIRETAAAKEARIREELRCYYTEAAEIQTRKLLDEHQKIINDLNASHRKQLLETRTEVYEEVERDRQANEQQNRVKSQESTIKRLDDYAQQSDIIKSLECTIDDLKIKHQQDLLDQWSNMEETHYDQLLNMLKEVDGLDINTSVDRDRKYIRIGSTYSYAVWNFTLDGTFVFQTQFEFEAVS
jgi:hypothetical protein